MTTARSRLFRRAKEILLTLIGQRPNGSLKRNQRRVGSIQALGAMTCLSIALTVLFWLTPTTSSATSLCLRPPVDLAFDRSTAVVAVSATAVSIKELSPGQPLTQTVLWRVSKSWKGPYREGSIFTTRNRLDIPVARGNAMLLFLSDREPYLLDTACSRSGRLEDSLDDVQTLEKLSAKTRRMASKNSLKPNP
jgi:hypothetical protein